jgi:hypothetical protein
MIRLNRLLDELESLVDRLGAWVLKAALAAVGWIVFGLLVRAAWELFLAGWSWFGLF